MEMGILKVDKRYQMLLSRQTWNKRECRNVTKEYEMQSSGFNYFANSHFHDKQE